MAVLEKIRVKLGVFITIVIALALLSFIIDPTTLEAVSNSMSSKYDVGEINGKRISYQDFENEVENFTTLSEITSGTSARNEQQMEAIRNAAWQSMLDRYLFIRNAKNAGIAVGEAEMLALTTGDMVSPVIAQDPNFLDESGSFSKDRLVELVQNIQNLSPEHRVYAAVLCKIRFPLHSGQLHQSSDACQGDRGEQQYH